MKTAIITVLVLILMVYLYGCLQNKPQSTVESPSASMSESSGELSSKIALLQSDMGQYNEAELHVRKNETSVQCIDALAKVLSDKDSVYLNEDEILGSVKNFYLKLSGTTIINDISFRLAEFGNSNNGEGTKIVIFLQSWKGQNGNVSVQSIYDVTIAENIPVLLDYGVCQVENNYYINIIDKLYTPETIVMHLSTYKYENLKWMPYIATEEFNDTTWKLEIESDVTPNDILISCSKIDSVEQYELECQFENSHLKIAALNDQKEIIGSLDLLFDNGKWTVENQTINSGTPEQTTEAQVSPSLSAEQ